MHLVVHLGLPKTGTSWLQASLATLRSSLAKNNYYYPLPLSGHGEEAGNANWIPPLIHQKKTNILYNEISRIQNSIKYKNNSTIICFSSESFSWLTIENYTLLLDVFLSQFETVKFILVNRERISFTKSAYSQSLKRERETASLNTFTRFHKDRIDQLLQLEIILSKMLEKYHERTSLIVKSFDNDKLINILKDIIGEHNAITLQDEINALSINPINTAVHEIKYELLRFYNSILADFPERKFLKGCDASEISTLNFNEKTIKDLAGELCNHKNHPDFEQIVMSLIGTIVILNDDLKADNRASYTQLAYLASPISKLIFQSAGEFKNKCPKDFDPFIYLILNQDVLRAQLDPYEHYVKHGSGEGRHFNLHKIEE